MSGLYDRVKRDQKTKKDVGVYLPLALAAGFLIVAVIFVAWFIGYQKRLSKFIANLSNSTTYAYANDSLIAEVNGKTYRVSEENMYGIFSYLSLNKSGRESGKAPEGEPVVLDYGDGTTLRLWEMPEKEGAKGHHDMFIQYTDAGGNTYSFISYKTTLETVVVQYLTYGNEELAP